MFHPPAKLAKSTMTIPLGTRVWIPCEVNSGPFTDERRVLVDSEQGQWLGFVHERWLEHHPKRGPDRILGVVVHIRGDTLKARLPGSSLAGGLFEGPIDVVEQSGSVSA